MRRDAADRRRVSTSAEDVERDRLLRAWRRSRGVARLVAEIEERRLASALGYRGFDADAIRAAVLSGETINVYDYMDPRRVRVHVANLRRVGLNVAALGYGTGLYKLMPADQRRPPRSRRRTETRESLLAGEPVTCTESTYWPVMNAVGDLRRRGHKIERVARGTYQLVAAESEQLRSTQGKGPVEIAAPVASERAQTCQHVAAKQIISIYK